MQKKILYVDDEPDQIFTLDQLLSEYDEFELVGANNAKECFEQLGKDSLPDLIFLDIMMNDVSGWELFDKIKNNPLWEKIPIVFLTARTDNLAEDAGTFLGDDYIEKPFQIEKIIQVINTLTGQKGIEKTGRSCCS
jgi:CheY-like chemotaxis protein